ARRSPVFRTFTWSNRAAALTVVAFVVLVASARGQLIAVVGAEGGTRTPTPLRAHDPESCASANSATSARRASFIIPSSDGQSSRGQRRPDDIDQSPGAARVRNPRDGRGRARAARDRGQVAARRGRE